MKKIFSLLLICLVYASISSAQVLPDRYKAVIFPTIPAPTTGILFSTNIPHVSTTTIIFTSLQVANEESYPTNFQNLRMDIYQPPTTDTLTKRPVIIFCFGGGFVQQAEIQDMRQLAAAHARRGFVTAVIDYRLGMNVSDPELSKRAVYRGIQDSRSAVRFFRQHANTITYKVDPNQIFLAGHSAGGFMAVHNIYLDTDAERPASTRLYQVTRADLGGLDAIGNNKTQTSGPNTGALINGKANGALAYAGAVGELSYIIGAGDAPAAYFHSSNDGTVPYTNGQPFGGIPFVNLPTVYGGFDMNANAGIKGAPRIFYPYNGSPDAQRNHGVHYDGTNIYADIPVRGGQFTWDFRLKPAIPTLTSPTIICDQNLTQNVTLSNPVTIGGENNFYYEWTITGGTINTPSSATYSATAREYLNSISVTWSAAAPTRSISVWIYQRNLARALAAFTQTFTLNNAPVAATAVPTQNIQIGGGAQTVNIATAFTDPNSNPMTYTATSSNTANLTVSVSPTGVVTLTPVTSGTGGAITVTLIANDNIGGGCASAPVTFVVNINRPPVATAIPNQTLQIGGANGTLNIASNFSDPDGNTLTFTSGNGTPTIATATLTGTNYTFTPIALGTTTITVTANDGNGGTVNQTFTVTVACPTITLANPTGTNATIGTPYALNAGATGNTTTLTYSVSPVLPASLTLDTSTGVISGTPNATAVATNYTITATQGTSPNACTGSRVYNFAVVCPTITIAPATLPNGVVSATVSYNQVLSQTGLTGTVTWSVVSGALPLGVTLDPSTGVISGIATLGGTANFMVQATNGVCTQTRVYALVMVCPTISFTNTTATNATIGTLYTLNAGATGNNFPLTYSVSPLLPAGLVIDAGTGAITGTPSAITAAANYTVTASQSAGTCVVTQIYNFAVTCPTINIAPISLLGATIGASYTANLSQTGLVGTSTWSVSVGTLPTNITLNTATGALSGTPTALGTSNFTIQVTDGVCSQTRVFSIAVTCPTISFTNTTATNATIGTPYTLNAGATGNTTTLTYSVSPALPANLTLNTSTGVISGTPTVPTPATAYMVMAMQGTAPNDCMVMQTYTFAVNCTGFSITPATLPNGTATVAYNQALSTNLTGTITWSVSPALPAGITLSTLGVISGTTATVSASTAYVVSASNGACNTSQTYNLAFGTPCTLVVVSPSLLALPNATLGVAYSAQFTAVGGTVGATYTFSTSTPLPRGLTFVNGLLSGIPEFSTSVIFRVAAATSGGCIGTAIYTLVILPDPATAIDNSLSNAVKVFPNPSKDIFNVDFRGLQVLGAGVRVYDVQGKIVYENKVNANEMSISLGNLSAGIYLMEVETTKGRVLKRLVRE